MKKIKLILIAFVVISLFSINSVISEVAVDTTALCMDSDGGKDYYIKGETTGFEVDGVTISTFNDFCSNLPTYNTAYNLVEQYCKGDYVYADFYTCPNGCEDGACINEIIIACVEEGKYTRGAVSPAYQNSCCAGLQGFDTTQNIQPQITGRGVLCYDPAKGEPTCGAIGTRSEGWYYSNGGDLLTYDDCAPTIDVTAPIQFDLESYYNYKEPIQIKVENNGDTSIWYIVGSSVKNAYTLSERNTQDIGGRPIWKDLTILNPCTVSIADSELNMQEIGAIEIIPGATTLIDTWDQTSYFDKPSCQPVQAKNGDYRLIFNYWTSNPLENEATVTPQISMSTEFRIGGYDTCTTYYTCADGTRVQQCSEIIDVNTGIGRCKCIVTQALDCPTPVIVIDYAECPANCECDGDEISCSAISPDEEYPPLDIAYPVICNDGCVLNDKCVIQGTRVDFSGKPGYCDISNRFEKQIDNEEVCNNNYECKSNFCSNGACYDIAGEMEETQGLLARITKFLSGLFGFE